MRSIVVLALLLVPAACGGGGGAPDASSICCPIEEPTCDCFQIGGTRQGGDCAAICDAEPDGWIESVDENGCPILEWVGGTGSCFWLPDAGVDAGDPDAAALDAGDLDAAPDGG